MNVNVYLPDDLGQRAKEAELPLSQLLRGAVVDELERRRAVSATLSNEQEYLLELEDNDGSYTGRVTGKVIAVDDSQDLRAFLTTDERVLVYDGRRLTYTELDESEVDETIRETFPPSEYADAMRALGLEPVIDL